ncbi:unnamed protein product [Victoria cruziana]
MISPTSVTRFSSLQTNFHCFLAFAF